VTAVAERGQRTQTRGAARGDDPRTAFVLATVTQIDILSLLGSAFGFDW